MRQIYLAAATLAALPSCLAGGASDAAVTPQRPTVSSDTSTTAEGTLELEAGLALDPDDSTATPLALKLGLAERTEVFAGLSPFNTVERSGDDGEGFGDLVLGMRHRIETSDERTSYAVQAASKLPTGDEDEGFSTGEVDFFLAGIFSRASTSGPSFTGFYELGVVGDPRRRSDTDLQHVVALALSQSVDGDLSAFGELARIDPGVGDDYLLGTFGLAHRAHAGLVVDGAISVGLDDDAPDLVFLVGFTTQLGRLARQELIESE